METSIYSVLDVKGEEFGPVFLAKNDLMAQRTVLETLRSGQSLLARYSEDFMLYRLGWFDSSTGVIRAVEHPLIVCGVKDISARMEGGTHV